MPEIGERPDAAAGSDGHRELSAAACEQLPDGRDQVAGVHVGGAAGTVAPRRRALPDEHLGAVLVRDEHLDPGAAEVQPRDQSPVHSVSAHVSGP